MALVIICVAFSFMRPKGIVLYGPAVRHRRPYCAAVMISLILFKRQLCSIHFRTATSVGLQHKNVINLTPAQLSLLLPLAMCSRHMCRTRIAWRSWGSWSMDITCSDGRRSYRPVTAWEWKCTTTKTCETVPTPKPVADPAGWLPVVSAAVSADAKLDTPHRTWTGWKWGKGFMILPRVTCLAALSYAATMSTNCGAIWSGCHLIWRRCLRPQPP